MAVGIFNFVPIIQPSGGAQAIAAVFGGVSTSHNDGNTDAGRLYGTIENNSGVFTVSIYDDFGRGGISKVLEGNGSAGWITLVAQNDSTLDARVLISKGTDTVDIVFVVSFAIDADVLKLSSECAGFPGYDADFGLAAFHAQAMKEILANRLPAAIPRLYEGKKLSAFSPYGTILTLPAINEIQNPEGLRAAQAALVKAMSAEEAEHLAEWAEIARLARGRFESEMSAIGTANTLPAGETNDPVTSGVYCQFSEFTRR